MENMLEARGLCKKYEGFTLAGISVALSPGMVLGVFGPNGAGKTTLIKLLAGQFPPESGEVRVFGLGFEDNEREIKDRIGYCPQEPPFYPDNTPVEIARFAAPFFSRWDGAFFYGLLDRLHIWPDKKFRYLSTGQKTLFSLALAVSHRPDLLLLDEPAAGLDDANRRLLLDLIRGFVGEGDKAVLISSHVSDGLDDVAERVLFIGGGAQVLAADKEELLARWKWVHFRAGALDGGMVAELADVHRQPFGSSGLCPDFPALRERLADAMAAGNVRVENARLSDVLVHLTQGG
jgi:ABC-2 type transport system ATP-binding protein